MGRGVEAIWEEESPVPKDSGAGSVWGRGQLVASSVTRGGRLPEWGECRDTDIIHSEGWCVQVQLWGPRVAPPGGVGSRFISQQRPRPGSMGSMMGTRVDTRDVILQLCLAFLKQVV